MEGIIKEMLKIWLNKDSFSISETNFIQKKNENNYEVSITIKDKEEQVFVSLYDIYISDEEFRIIEK